MLTAVLALCCCADAGSPEEPVVYAKLTSVELDSAADYHEGWTLYDCKGDEGVLLTVWTKREELPDSAKVRATLKVIQHQKGVLVEAFVEYRLTVLDD
jgi:hypothetical protein